MRFAAPDEFKFSNRCIDKTQNQIRTDPAAAAPRSFPCSPNSS